MEAFSSSSSESAESELDKLRFFLNDISSSSKATNDRDSTATRDDHESLMLAGCSSKNSPQATMQKEPEEDEVSSVKGGDENPPMEGLLDELVEVDRGEENETSTGSIGKLIGEFIGPRGKIIKMYDFMGLYSSSEEEKEFGEKDKFKFQTYEELNISDDMVMASPILEEINFFVAPPIHEERVVMASPNLQETNMVIAPPVLEEVNTVVAPPILEEINFFMAPPILEENMIMAAPNPHQQVLPDQDPWRVQKVLTTSDVDGSCRLLIGRDIVSEHILPHVLRDNADFNEKQGTELAIWDVDTGTEHKLRFKKWITTNSFVFNGGWTSDFVKRRNLKENDKIGLRWDDENSRLEFTVIHRNHQE